MLTPMPSYFATARTAWSDLFAVVRTHRLLACWTLIACSFTALLNVLIQSDEETLLDMGLGIVDALLLTTVLVACHRFVIRGEVTQDYASVWLSRRFWRYFLLSAALVTAASMSIVLMQWWSPPDEIAMTGFFAAAITLLAAALWLSLMFPAIAVDAPGVNIVNAAQDIRGNVWRIFWSVILASLPLLLAAIALWNLPWVVFDEETAPEVRIAFSPLQGVLFAAIDILTALIASRFYLLLGSRLRQPG